MRSRPHVVNMAAVRHVDFSSRGDYLAYSGPDGVLKIFDTATGTLKQEYTPSSHLSATCSCLTWSPGGRTCTTPKHKRKKRKSLDGSVGEGADLIALGTTSGSVIIYSLVKGDLQTVLSGGHSDTVHASDWTQSGDALYTCSADHNIVQWDLTLGNVKQKWKADRRGVYSLCLCHQERYLLSAGRMIKLWDLATRTAVKTFTGHATEVFRLLTVPGSMNGEADDGLPNFYFLSAATDERLISVWHTVSKERTAVASFALPDEPTHLSLSQSGLDEPIQLAAVTKSGELSVFEHGLNGPAKKPVQPRATVQVASEGGSSTPKPIPILAAHLCGDMVHNLLFCHGSFLQLTFEKLKANNLDVHTCLVRKDQSRSLVRTEASVSKVKTPEISGEVRVLAPGHMAPSAPIRQDVKDVPVRRKRRKSASGEMSLDERLTALSIDKQAVAGASGGTEPPRADALATLLTQGLQSNDRKLLNNVLQNQKEVIIRSTVKRLPVPVIVPLVQELSRRMQGHSQSGQILVKWMKAVLTLHTSYLMTFPELVDTLGKVYQMMESRTSLLARLLRLQGKLDLMLSQVSSQTEEEDAVSSQQPMLVFQDESSDEDAYSGDLVAESADEWNEDMSDTEDAKENGDNEDGADDKMVEGSSDSEESEDTGEEDSDPGE